MDWFRIRGTIGGETVVATWVESPDQAGEEMLRRLGHRSLRLPSPITLAAVFVDGLGSDRFAVAWELQRGQPVGATPTGPGWAAAEWPARAAYVSILALLDADGRRFSGSIPELPVDVPADAIP